MSTREATHCRRRILVGVGVTLLMAVSSSAQDAAGTQPHVVTISAGFDVLNQYMFRGVRQNSTELVMWPFVDLGITPHSSDGAFKSLRVDFGFWNSLHTGDTGSSGPSGGLWYESRFNATVGLRFGGGVSVGTTYTAYTSPNDMFTTVKEIAVRLEMDDRKALGRASVSPYALIAFELSAHPGMGQLDGGLHAGKYLELGVAPGFAARHARVAVPVKVGLSLGDYYELAGKDNTFGFVSVGGIVTVPLLKNRGFGAWNVHGGADVQAFGETTKVFNGGDRHKVIGLVGVGLSY